MPILDLFENGNIRNDAGIQTLAVMFWPINGSEHEIHRLEFCLVVEGLLTREQYDKITQTAIYKEANKRWRDGFHAGHYLHSIHDASKSDHEEEKRLASKGAIRKAWGGITGDGLEKSASAVDGYWRRCKPSLHLWAALIELFDHHVPEDWGGWLPATPKELRDLWAIAYNALAWGGRYISEHNYTSEPLLNPAKDSFWLLPSEEDPRTN